MKLILTGASGYVGGWIASELNRREINWRPLKSRLLELQLDEIEGSDIVIHCAAEHRTTLNISDSLIWETNLNGTENLLKKCKKVGVKRFILISTIVANDKGAYSESKLAAENILKKIRF
jgi:nucleoside-diphosphate-sugar epimerase